MAARMEVPNQSSNDDIERTGCFKKLKTMRKKYFVLRRESANLPARLEYYDSQKKFEAGAKPKKSIDLKKCFNINKRTDTKVKNCIALYTKDNSFCIVLDSDEEANEWLNSLLEVQNGGVTIPGEVPKPTFEFVWEVRMQEKGLGAQYGIVGPYRVCLTAKSLSLLKMGCKDEAEDERSYYKFSLASIRSCGFMEKFFYMEVGRGSVTGAGELWMITVDNLVATHMHRAIYQAMAKGNRNPGATPPTNDSELDSMGPKPRARSSSATEASKPIYMQQRRLTHGNDSVTSLSYLGTTTPSTNSTSLLSSHNASPATTDTNLAGSETSGSRERCDSLPCAPRLRTTSEGYVPASSAPHHHNRLLGHLPGQRPASMYAKPSPPIDCSPVSPTSAGCSTDSAGSSLSIDEIDSSLPWPTDHQRHHGRNSLSDSAGGFTPPSSRYSALDNGRYKLLSPDESVACPIAEESLTDYLHWPQEEEYVPMERQTRLNLPLVSSMNNNNNNNNNNNKYDSSKTAGSPSEGCYMDMSINSPSSSSPLDTAGGYMVMSPGADVTPQAPQASSFSMGMYMSSGAGSISSANHSRASSMAEETPLGYVPMLPTSMQHRQESLVDLDHSKGSIGGSSCSLTSGTPSMTNTGDFSHPYSSEFHLEKASSYFVPSEDEEDRTSVSLQPSLEASQLRPTRAYSLGSRPERQSPAQPVVRTEPRPTSAKIQTHRSPSRSRKNTAPAAYLSSSWSGSGCNMPTGGVPKRLQTIQQHQHRHDEDENFSLLDFSKGEGSAEDSYVEMRVDGAKRSQPINIGHSKSSSSPVQFSLHGFFSRKNSSCTPPKVAVATESTSSSPFSSLKKRHKKTKRNSDVTTPMGMMFPISPLTPSKSVAPEEQFARLNVDDTVIERRVGSLPRPPPSEQLRPRNSASESDYVPMQPSSKQREEALARKAQSESVLTKDDYSEGSYALMMARPKTKPLPVAAKQPPPQDSDYAFMDLNAGPAHLVESKPVEIPPPAAVEPDSDYAMMLPGDGTPVLLGTPKKTASDAAIELSRSPDTAKKDIEKPKLKLTGRTLEPVKEASRSPRELSKEDEGDYAVLAPTTPTPNNKSEYVLMTPIIKPPMLLMTDVSLHLNHSSTAHSPVLAKEPLLVSEPKQSAARPLKASSSSLTSSSSSSRLPELNYASLESQDSDAESQPQLMRNLSSDSSGESDVTTVCATQYAQIDFERTQQQQQQTQQQQQAQKPPAQPQQQAPKKSKVQ